MLTCSKYPGEESSTTICRPLTSSLAAKSSFISKLCQPYIQVNLIVIYINFISINLIAIQLIQILKFPTFLTFLTYFAGKSDRQTAVLKWIIKEIYCHIDQPLDINLNQFEVLIRSFRNFILVLSSPKIKSSRHLIQQFRKTVDWCDKTNRILVVSTDKTEIIKSLDLPRRPPMILHIVHGLYIIFDGNLADINAIQEWMNVEVPTNLR
jgi:hypothetical protein